MTATLMESGTMTNTAQPANTGVGFLLVLTGPSGAGKGTLVEHIVKQRPDCVFSVSATTRPKRSTEVEGRDYYFLSQDEFLQREAQGWFLETAEVHGHLYGTPVEQSMSTCARAKWWCSTSTCRAARASAGCVPMQ
jgi:guanylate kinase